MPSWKGTALAIGLALALAPVRADALDAVERAALHTVMVQHIDKLAIDGMWMQVDMQSGQVRQLAPAKSHPMILQMGEAFVLCTDFVGLDGQPVNIDFYAVRQNGSFKIFQTEIANRRPLEALVAAGRAAPVD
jgi:hypothetical protein